MGFLTPILIHNDCVHIFKNKKLQKEICEKIYYACLLNKEKNISIAGYCNYIKSLGYKHADNSRVIVVHGNTWKDVTRESYKGIGIDRIDDGYIEY